MRDVVVLFVVALLFIASTVSRITALNTYWWFAIFRPQDWIWSDVGSLRLPLIAALLFVVPSVLVGFRPKLSDPLAVLMVAFVALGFIAQVVAGCGNDFFVVKTLTATELGTLVLVVLLTVEVVNTRKKLFALVSVVSLSLAFHSGKGGIYAMLKGSNNYGAENLSGFLSGSNAYALGTAMVLFYMIASYQGINEFFKKNIASSTVLVRGTQLVGFLAIFGSIYNVISLQSRGSFIAMCLGLVVWAFLQPQRWRILLGGVVAVFIVLTFVEIPESFYERISSVFVEDPGERDFSAASRPHFWKTAVKMASDNPLGVGCGCYPAYYDRYDESGGFYGRFRSVHSSHFQVLADLGYLGALLWASVFVVAFKRLFEIRSRLLAHKVTSPPGFLLAIVNCLIASQVVFVSGGAFYENAYNDITWLSFGLIIVVTRLVNNEMEPGTAESKNFASKDSSLEERSPRRRLGYRHKKRA